MRPPIRQLACLALEFVEITAEVIARLAELLLYLVCDFAHWMFSRTMDSVRSDGSAALNALRPAVSKAAPTIPASRPRFRLGDRARDDHGGLDPPCGFRQLEAVSRRD